MKAGGTWALKFPPPQKIKLTAVVKGTCWLAVKGERAPLRLETGDVFMMPAERSYVLASDLKASQLDGLALFTKATDNVATVGDGKDFFAIGGHVSLDPVRGGGGSTSASTRARNRRVIGWRLGQDQPETLTQRKRIRCTPRNGALGVQPFEISDQQQPEVATRRQAGAAVDGVGSLAETLDESATSTPAWYRAVVCPSPLATVESLSPSSGFAAAKIVQHLDIASVDPELRVDLRSLSVPEPCAKMAGGTVDVGRSVIKTNVRTPSSA